MVCEHDIYPTVGLAALNLGGPIGVYCFGLLNDRWVRSIKIKICIITVLLLKRLISSFYFRIGRRKSYFLCLATLILGSLLTASAMNFWWWAASRVIVGLTIPAVYQIPFIICEYELYNYLEKKTKIKHFKAINEHWMFGSL